MRLRTAGAFEGQALALFFGSQLLGDDIEQKTRDAGVREMRGDARAHGSRAQHGRFFDAVVSSSPRQLPNAQLRLQKPDTERSTRKTRHPISALQCPIEAGALQMGTTSKWFGKAIRGLRSFAYGTGRPPESRGRAGRRVRSRHRAHRRAARHWKNTKSPLIIIAGTSVGALIAAAYASGTSLDEMARQGTHHALPRFRPLDAFAHGHGFQRASRGFPPPIHGSEKFQTR